MLYLGEATGLCPFWVPGLVWCHTAAHFWHDVSAAVISAPGDSVGPRAPVCTRAMATRHHTRPCCVCRVARDDDGSPVSLPHADCMR